MITTWEMNDWCSDCFYHEVVNIAKASVVCHKGLDMTKRGRCAGYEKQNCSQCAVKYGTKGKCDYCTAGTGVKGHLSVGNKFEKRENKL